MSINVRVNFFWQAFGGQKTCLRRSEASVYIRGDTGECGGQRAIGDRKAANRRKKGKGGRGWEGL